jgi:hypothetical protein
MTYPTQPAPPPPPPKRKARTLLLILAAALLALASCGIGAGIGASGKKAAAPSSTPTVYVTTTVTATATGAAKPAATPKATPTPAAKVTIPDGYKIVVGEDAPAGTYEAHSTSTDCYWEIDKHATSDIVDNDVGKLGHLVVVLKKGEDFSSASCGDWVKK